MPLSIYKFLDLMKRIEEILIKESGHCPHFQTYW